MTTGQKIVINRKLKNLTQDQLGDLLGVSRQAISRWESDLAYPETESLIKMSKIFDCSLDYLLNDAVEQEKQTSPTFKDHVTVGDLVVRHWRKIYIPLYISGTAFIFIGVFILIMSNVIKLQQSNDYFPNMGIQSDAQSSMLSSMKTIFNLFGGISIVLGIVILIIATTLLFKEKKENQK